VSDAALRGTLVARPIAVRSARRSGYLAMVTRDFSSPARLVPRWLRENGTIEMAAKLTNIIIRAAIDGFEAQKKNIDAQIAELRAMLTGAPDTEESVPAKGTRRKFSAAARRRMREAQQLRWAKIKGESATLTKTAAKTAKSKRGITAAGRKALSVAMKKRWAAKKAAAA
jgi:hypothetical protein